jgi:hypothetical protein
MSILLLGLDREGYRVWFGMGSYEGLECDGCRSAHLRGHGSYARKAVVTTGGAANVLIRRVLCVSCGRAPSIVPDFLVPGLRAVDAVVETATARYLDEVTATYRAVAALARVAHATVHRWLTRVGSVSVAVLMAALVGLRPTVDFVSLVPKLVPGEGRKARSPARREILRNAQRVLFAGRLYVEETARGLGMRRPTIGSIIRLTT